MSLMSNKGISLKSCYKCECLCTNMSVGSKLDIS